MSVVYVYYRAHFWLILYKRRLQSNVDLHRGASETLFGKGRVYYLGYNRILSMI